MFRYILAAAVMVAAVAGPAPVCLSQEEAPMVEARYLGFHVYPTFTRLVFDTGGVPPEGFRVNYVPERRQVVFYPLQGHLAYSFAPVGRVSDAVGGIDFAEEGAQRGVVVRLAQDARAPDIYFLTEPFRLVMDVHRARQDGPSQPGRPVRTVVIDPGHGGRDAGCRGGGSAQEKDIALDLAVRVKGILARMGYLVLLTREADADVPPEARAAMADSKKADLFLSIHLSGSFAGKGRGAAVYVMEPGGPDGGESRKGLWDEQAAPYLPESVRLALSVSAAVGRLYGRETAVHEARLAGMGGLAMPAVSAEVGDLSDPEQASALSDDSFRKKVAAGLAKGIDDYAKGVKR